MNIKILTFDRSIDCHHLRFTKKVNNWYKSTNQSTDYWYNSSLKSSRLELHLSQFIFPVEFINYVKKAKAESLPVNYREDFSLGITHWILNQSYFKGFFFTFSLPLSEVAEFCFVWNQGSWQIIIGKRVNNRYLCYFEILWSYTILLGVHQF